MVTLGVTLVIFLILMEWLVIIDVICSWLTLLGMRVRPRFLADILDPIYIFTRKYIPTRFGVFDFTPIIILLGILFLRGTILILFPEVGAQMNAFLSR